MAMCRRGDIYYVDFGQDTTSCVQCGVRPALVVSNNRANESSPVITVVPLTARTYKRRGFPTHVLIPRSSGSGLDKNSMTLAEQVSTIDKSRLMERKGTVTDVQVMAAITKALQIQIGAVETYN